jgi:site-specific DNA-methyltransferase (adenine-specific)
VEKPKKFHFKNLEIMITATNEDNMLMMARYPDNYFDLAIVDIPYGLGDKLTQGGTWASKYKKGDTDWDKLPTKKYFDELFRVSKNQIIWGGNYAHKFLTSNRHFIIWDKLSHMPTMADCEYAWSSLDSNAKIYKHSRNTTEKRIHITQKPIKLYEYCLMNYAKQGDKIVDTHRGSASLDIACHNLGFDLVTCELDTDYFNDGNKRLKQHQNQLKMF